MVESELEVLLRENDEVPKKVFRQKLMECSYGFHYRRNLAFCQNSFGKEGFMLVFIRGAGDLATGISIRLHRAGISVCHSDLAVPTAVRRNVAFSEAIRLGECSVEGITAVRADTVEEIEAALAERKVPVLVDEGKEFLHKLKPDAVVDAILAKRNLGTAITDARAVIGVGPGFIAGVDCHAVVESKRGHELGRVLLEGSATPNTGIPGIIGGYGKERVLRAPTDGILEKTLPIGTLVKAGDVCAVVNGIPMRTEIAGVLRGMLQEGITVFAGMKAGDVDPRGEAVEYRNVSDKARAIGGGVLEALLHFLPWELCENKRD